MYYSVYVLTFYWSFDLLLEQIHRLAYWFFVFFPLIFVLLRYPTDGIQNSHTNSLLLRRKVVTLSCLFQLLNSLFQSFNVFSQVIHFLVELFWIEDFSSKTFPERWCVNALSSLCCCVGSCDSSAATQIGEIFNIIRRIGKVVFWTR